MTARTQNVLVPTFVALLIMSLLLLTYWAGVAFADAGVGSDTVAMDAAPAVAPPPSATIPDPIENPVQAIKAVRDQAERVGIFAAILLAIYIIAATILSRFRSHSWLATGRRLAYLTAAVGLMAVSYDATLGVGTWSGVLAYGMTAMGLVLSPTVPPATTAPKA
jgi:hypothetical protein